MFVAGAYVAGVSQAEFDAAASVPDLIDKRIRPALDDPTNRARFEALMIDLTGGPRAFDRAGLRDEEGTNWERAELLVSAQLAAPRTTPYELGPGSGVSSEAFNRAAIRVPTDREAFRAFTAGHRRDRATADASRSRCTRLATVRCRSTRHRSCAGASTKRAGRTCSCNA